MKSILHSLVRRKRKSEGWVKYLMSVSHLWLGLLSSIILFLVCFSGSVYVFRYQIEDIVDWSNAHVGSSRSYEAIDLALSNFESLYGEATYIQVPAQQGRSLVISSQNPQGAGVKAYFHPETGELMAKQNQWSRNFFDFVLSLHRFLLAGEVGKLINGIAVLVFTYMLFSGIILWFPKKLKKLKSKLTIRWNARFYRLNYDLHSVLGIYFSGLLLLISLTGLYVSFHWVKNLMIVGLGGSSIVLSEDNTRLKRELSETFGTILYSLENDQQKSQKESWSLAKAINEVDVRFPDEGSVIIRLPTKNTKNTQITKVSSENWFGFQEPNTVNFSITGSILTISDFRSLPLDQQFKAVAKPLHTGEILGLPTMIIYFLASLVGCSVPITGFLMWSKKVLN